MKTDATQKEILLVTNNSFAQRQWCNNTEPAYKNTSPQEQMEEVCANGLIYEILPELFKVPANHKLYLWQMRPGFSFLQLQYGEFPLALENRFSVDPHNFLAYLYSN